VVLELLLICAMVVFWTVITLLTMISRRNKIFFCQKTMTLANDAFIGESQYGKSETRWTAVQKLARTRNHLFIYLGQELALVIPRRAFENTQQWDAFYNFCAERTKQAKTAGQAPVSASPVS